MPSVVGNGGNLEVPYQCDSDEDPDALGEYLEVAFN